MSSAPFCNSLCVIRSWRARRSTKSSYQCSIEVLVCHSSIAPRIGGLVASADAMPVAVLRDRIEEWNGVYQAESSIKQFGGVKSLRSICRYRPERDSALT